VNDKTQLLEALRAVGIGELAESMGIEVDLESDVVVGRMPVAGNRQPYHLLHGGATAVLVESIGSIAAALSAPGKMAMGIELSVSHHRAATSGVVTARTEAVHVGSTLASYIIPVVDDRGRRIATGRLTCLLREPSP
jgi:1,4-dihydroxy-2-naphthoyl-CoA hydrolase